MPVSLQHISMGEGKESLEETPDAQGERANTVHTMNYSVKTPEVQGKCANL